MTARQIGIHTICYKPEMVAAVDPDFLPFDVSAEPQEERRETAHMLAFWRLGMHREYKVSGLLSPKFAQKTAIDGAIFNDFIKSNPDYDVWFFNPYPHYFYLSHDIWEHGEIWYPGLCERASLVFASAGMAIDLANFPRSTRSTLLFSNIWAGTTQFWDQFMAFVSHMASHAETVPRVFDTVRYENGKAEYYPFIFERLFTTFLLLHPGIKARYANFRIVHMLDMINKTDRLLVREWAPLIDKWDQAGVYTEDQRTIFRGIQKLSILGMHANNPEALRALLAL
jgi:hypothetical protein